MTGYEFANGMLGAFPLVLMAVCVVVIVVAGIVEKFKHHD